MEREEDTLILRQDELFEMLTHLDKKEGLPADKKMKNLKKIGANLTQLKADCGVKDKEITTMKEKESNLYRKKITEFEEELKTYQGGLKKEAYYFYKSGLELAQKRIGDVTADLDRHENTMEELQHIADNFSYPKELNASRKVMQQMRDDVKDAKALWEFEVYRIQQAEKFLVQKWGTFNSGEMEDDVKETFKRLKVFKVDSLKKCDAFISMQDILKKWVVFCPLVGELKDKAMRERHWTQLMGLCGKNINVTPDILLRDMWNLELHKFPDPVEDTADQAKQEAKMKSQSRRSTTSGEW
jgi:dynein heavy chain